MSLEECADSITTICWPQTFLCPPIHMAGLVVVSSSSPYGEGRPEHFTAVSLFFTAIIQRLH